MKKSCRTDLAEALADAIWKKHRVYSIKTSEWVSRADLLAIIHKHYSPPKRRRKRQPEPKKGVLARWMQRQEKNK